MKGNPYNGATMVLANGDPIEELRFGSGRERALSASTGEFNASDNKDLVQAISNLMSAVASGQVVPQNQAVAASAQERAREVEARREVLAAARADSTGDTWAALGATIANRITEQSNREGFLRRVSVGNTLKQGEVPRVPMPSHDAVAVVATSTSDVGYQMVRNKMFQPEEFEINANVRVEQLDIDQVSGDILEDAYNQGLEAIMVQEDRLWKHSADMTVGVVNELQYIAGSLTTKILGNLRQAVAEHNLPVTSAIISNDYWSDIIGSSDFSAFFDPITKYDLAMNGQLGTLVGMELITDAFRQPNQKVLNKGEIYIVAAPDNHAAYTDRGGVRSTPTTGADSGNTSRGWLMSEPFSFVLANARSVAKGQRV
jgi:hypothetical protein